MKNKNLILLIIAVFLVFISFVSATSIEIDPPLPSSVCEYEKIDITLDLGVVNLRWGLFDEGYISCAFNGQKDISVTYCLMEDDSLTDDEVQCSYGTATTYDCETLDLENFRGILVKRKFVNIDLSEWIKPDPGGNGEFYARVSNYNNYFYAISTPSYNVYGYVNGECECLSGSCCDTSSRPYEYKPSGTSCALCGKCNSVGSCLTADDDASCGTIDCSNWYVQTGTQSPTSTEFCYNKKDITSDRCEAFDNCKDSNTADCDNQLNDQLKYSCGTCKFIRTGDCTGISLDSCSNYAEGVSCGTDKECDGNGNCVSTCECTSGPCCDGCHWKPYGSQPTGYSDDLNGYCSDSNSPTGTSYIKTIDYYCSGGGLISNTLKTVDTCGICEYCTDNDLTCNYYSTSTSCGTQDCDYLEFTYPCRDYFDVDKYCNIGTCISPSCNDYTNKPAGTSCGSSGECDSFGNCDETSCTSHSYYECYDNDVYWYDSCDVREDKKQECDVLGCADGQCVGENNIDTIISQCAAACSTYSSWGYCTQNKSLKTGFEVFDDVTCVELATNPIFAQYNIAYCYNLNCPGYSEPEINCSSNTDCGADGWSGEKFCFLDDVWQTYTQYICHNANTINSYCEKKDTNQVREDCLYGCENGECISKPVSQPDLTVTDLIIQSQRGREFVLGFTIKNIGDATANNVYWMVDPDSTSNPEVRRSPVTLRANEETRAFMKISYPLYGSYVYTIYVPKVIVDYNNLVSESNENNNEKSITIYI